MTSVNGTLTISPPAAWSAILITCTGGQRPPPPDSMYSTAMAGSEGALLSWPHVGSVSTKGGRDEGGLVGGDQSWPRRSHNVGLSLDEKCGALGLSVCRDKGRTCTSSSFLVGT